jgi:hypothetical protein
MTPEVSVAKAGGLSDEVTFSCQIACISPWVQRFWEEDHATPPDSEAATAADRKIDQAKRS